ncbi:DUF4278 domain-containing protein [Laspinema olomoucense]|uniref:DUF4278 domain-containing protein n=1 Tax=Laspinema olomoucense TaxID=3231600 RepID=UPI0021BB829E|nr:MULTISPECIES: DUF4278 domain-containing protein [unclassified Laspinema]MCT7971832.1 DUF4278 domain-containing protein [Laspinema sp. D3d]MCT7991777.1 DUF4278 domain-containing protein [Laspinema sp. D3a]MCT7993436.1 DUF4278 domain-containing protein [Laspinema sp. D3c]
MKLTYRGISYESNPVPTPNITPLELAGQYRGVHWRLSNALTYPMEEPTAELMYRGATYSTGTAQVVVKESYETPACIPTAPVDQLWVANLEEKARALTLSNGLAIKKRQQAMLGRVAAEVGLSSDISNYWNRIQGKVHPSFRASYSRSSASLS